METLDDWTSLLDRVPVIPVVVLDDLDHAVPLARALVAGGLPVDRADPAHARSALDAIGRIAAEVPEILVGAGTIVAPGRPRARRRGRAVPRLAPAARPRCSPRWTTPGCRYLPGHVDRLGGAGRLLERGYTEMKFFPAEAVRRGAVPERRSASPMPQAAVLPDRRHHGGDRGVVPRAAERRLRRRLLAHPGRRARRGDWARIAALAAEVALVAV